MQEGISLGAGLDQRVSKALSTLDGAVMAVERNQPTPFWDQCVRDTRGTWTAYASQKSAYEVPYFRGKQETYKTSAERTYLLAHLDTRRAFYEGLAVVPEMSVDTFRNWLETLRCLLEYRKSESALHEKSITNKHTKLILEQILPIAKQYNDPYFLGTAVGPIFPGFPKESLPFDEVKGSHVYYHHYPSLNYTDIYLGASLRTFKRIINHDECARTQDYIHEVAYFFQLLINLHLFAAINVSLYMNMADGLLELAGLRGVEHGIMDFVAFRLQPETFQAYFYDTVIRAQI